MNFHLTRVSMNAKTGFMPVSTSSDETCPPECPMNGTDCYARYGNLGLHWRKVSSGERGVKWAEFIQSIKDLPKKIGWRHNQAGDLPGKKSQIDRAKLRELALANVGKRGFTYTHKPMTPANQRAVKEANGLGFTINLSADSLKGADELANLKIGPVVVVLRSDAPLTSFTPEGKKIVVCPATYRENVTCQSCMLCQNQKRTVIVGFHAHGNSAKRLSAKCN